MHVLALNSSPRGKKGATGRMLTALTTGMARAGARADVQVETVDLAGLSIAPCRACYACWTRTPGVCAVTDDMARVLALYAEADLVVFGTPLYHYTMNATMKLFLDRTLPLVEPWLCENPHAPGVSGHPQRREKPFAALLLSPCGLPEFSHFESLVHYFRFYAGRNGWNWLGEILRHSAEVLSRPDTAARFGWYFALLEQAGAEIIAHGGLLPDTAQTLAQDLFPDGPAAFRERANHYWAVTRKRHGIVDPIVEPMEPGPGVDF